MSDSYLASAMLSNDGWLNQRLTACAAQEGIKNPDMWVNEHRWDFASQPGWGSAWESALVGGIVDPGKAQSVISDGMILAAVQAVNSA